MLMGAAATTYPVAADPGELYQEALAAYRTGDMEAAAEKLKEALAQAPEDSALHTLQAWVFLRRGDISRAGTGFQKALELTPDAGEPQTGLGYVALRNGQVELALGWFESALELEPDSGDAARGRILALYRLGRMDDASAALEGLEPELAGDEALGELAVRLEDDFDPEPPQQEVRPRLALPEERPLQVVARAGKSYLQVPGGEPPAGSGGWSALLVKGVNLGVALPGKYPSEFPLDAPLYRDWLTQIAGLGANTVRLYTLLPPAFYDALLAHNEEHPDQKLWLIQGVWAVLPPEHDFRNATYQQDVQREVERVIDAFHGNLDLPPRPGHASGRYRSDVSAHVLALILGREWEPYSVVAFDRMHPGPAEYRGRYAWLEQGSAMEAWMAWLCDIAVAHETVWYRQQRPVAFSNWPTLDPLRHPTEASRDEENAFRRARGELVDERPALIYNDDAATVDAEKIRPGRANQAGLFASYHVYPYFPDFMNLDPGYQRAEGPRGASPYLGYLRHLKAHHQSQPLLVAEFGVPTSRGTAHVHPLGWNHGGHTEEEQGELLGIMMQDIVEARTAGGIVFAWLDEWFKTNWMFVDLEEPRERNRLWHNVMDPEQNFGILAARAGAAGESPILDGDGGEWRGLEGAYLRQSAENPDQVWDPCRTDPPRPEFDFLGLAADAAYLYLLSEIRGADCDQDRMVNWEMGEILIGIDTYDDLAGDRRLRPGDARRLPSGAEFRVRLAGPGRSDLQVDPPYDVELHLPGGPIASQPNEDGVFLMMEREANRRRFGRDGTEYPAIDVSHSSLRFARPGEPLHPQIDVVQGSRGTTGVVELRLPWNLLQITDPSSKRAVHHPGMDGPPFGTTSAEGIRVHVSLRSAGGEELDFESLPPFHWAGWDEPSYRLERKGSYEVLREAFASLPEIMRDSR
jgi:tetratricopeptide (TPR) repeat protein